MRCEFDVNYCVCLMFLWFKWLLIKCVLIFFDILCLFLKFDVDEGNCLIFVLCFIFEVERFKFVFVDCKVILLLFFVFGKCMLFDKVEVLLYGVFKIVDELFELDIEFGLFWLFWIDICFKLYLSINE